MSSPKLFRTLTIAIAAGFLAAALSAVPAFAYQAVRVNDGGRIVGSVKFDGPPPRPAKIDVTKDVEVCGRTDHFDQSLVVGTNGGIANAVVALPDIAQGKPFPPAHDLTFDQAGCEYTPHVLAFPAGAPLEVINSDGILHNVHDFPSRNPQINLAQPGFKKSITITIANPDLIRVECDAHNWMRGWWYVAGNPYYAVTGPDGRFELGDVPPGTYTIRVWQEKLGTQERKVKVKPGATATVDFTFAAKPG